MVETAESDEYACVSRGRLALKGDSGVTKKKKKNKKQRDTPRANKNVDTQEANDSQAKPRPVEQKRTPAEIAFQKMQEKMQKERIAQKASMTHKQRVEKFNQHLDSLTEHFDIPKVSWTK